MEARSVWQGHLRLALVSCPVRLTPGTTEAERIRLNKLNRETGNRLRQQMIDPETGEAVSGDEIVMGYQYEKGHYVTVEREELQELQIDSSQTLDIERFVEAGEVDWMYWDTPYIVEPDGKTGIDIFVTIREAMRRKKVTAIGRAVIGRRERAVLIQPCGKGMMLSTLRDADEVRIPKLFFQDIKDIEIDKEYLSMAEQLIDRMRGPFDPSLFEDRYQEALRTLVESKLKGERRTAPKETTQTTNVVNLFDALRASLAGTASTGKTRKSGSAARKSGGRKSPAAKTRQRKRA